MNASFSYTRICSLFLMALVVVVTDASAQNVTFSGYSRMYFETSDASRFNQFTPRTIFRWEAEPTVAVRGIPLSVNLLATTEENEVNTNINSLIASFNFSADRLEQTIRDRVNQKVGELSEEVAGRNIRSDPFGFDRVAGGLNQAREKLSQLQDIQSDVSNLTNNLGALTNMGLLTALERKALRFPNLGLGVTYPRYSPFTVDGLEILGAHVEFAPGLLYLAGTLGNVRNQGGNLQRLLISPGESFYKRRVAGGSLGLGRSSGNHVHFSGVLIVDDKDTLDDLGMPEAVLPPQRNVLAGVDFKISAAEQQFSLEGQLGGSSYTRDRDGIAVEDQTLISPLLYNLIDPNLSSSLDAAGEIKTTIRIPTSQTRFRAKVRYVGPGYVSLGAPVLRNDILSYEADINQGFLRRQISISARYRDERNNLDNIKLFTKSSRLASFQLGLHFKNLPYLRLRYQPTFLTTTNRLPVDAGGVEQTFEYAYDTRQLSVMTGYTHRVNDFVSSTSIAFSSQSIDATQDLIEYELKNYTLTQVFGLANMGLNLSYSFYDQSRLADPLDIHSIDVSGSFTAFEFWTSTLGVNFSKETGQGTLLRMHGGTTFPLWLLGTLDVRLENNQYKGGLLQASDFNQSRFSVSLIRTW
ncbi:MAG: hypothetical protein AB8G77_12735 [Rhodothermales bacterium]